MTIPTQASDLTISIGPSQADAQLLVQLAQLSTSMNVPRGESLLWSHRDEGLTYEQLKEIYQPPSTDASAILSVLHWHELVGTLVKQGLLDRGLALDWIDAAGAWELCGPIALALRAMTGDDRTWENFEALAASRTS